MLKPAVGSPATVARNSNNKNETRAPMSRRAAGDGRATKLPRTKLKLIAPEQLRQSQLCGIQTFGHCSLRVGARSLADCVGDRQFYKCAIETDETLAANEKRVGDFMNREQMGWVFRQLVKTADALGVPVKDPKAFKALNDRFDDPVAEAMLFLITVFVRMTRNAKEDQRLGRDPLAEAIERARAINAGRNYQSKLDRKREEKLRQYLAKQSA